MSYQTKRQVYKITETRGGAVYKTAKVCEVWIDVKPRTPQEENEIAKAHGGDMLVSMSTGTPYSEMYRTT